MWEGNYEAVRKSPALCIDRTRFPNSATAVYGVASRLSFPVNARVSFLPGLLPLGCPSAREASCLRGNSRESKTVLCPAYYSPKGDPLGTYRGRLFAGADPVSGGEEAR